MRLALALVHLLVPVRSVLLELAVRWCHHPATGLGAQSLAAGISQDLDWLPRTDMSTALHAIFDAYSDDLQKARELTPTGTFPALLPAAVAAHTQAAAR